MKASYAFLRTKQHKAIRAFKDDNDLTDLWNHVYPKIYKAMGDGKTDVSFNGGINHGIVLMLRKDGYRVNITNEVHVNIDWKLDA